MPAQRLTIGVAVDTDLGTVFRPLIESAKRARKEIDDVFAGAPAFAGGGRGGGVGRSASRGRGRSEEEKFAAEAIKAAERATQAKEKLGEQEVRTAGKAAAQRVREERKALSEIEKDLAQHNAKKQKDADLLWAHQERLRQQGEQNAKSAIRGFAGHVASGASRMLSTAGGIAGDVARGAGVDFNMGGMVSKFVERDKLARQLSNSAYQPQSEDKDARVKAKPADILSDVSKVAGETALDQTELIKGLQGFTALSGDLKGGRDLMKDMAVLSQSTGSNFEDMMKASAQVSQALESSFGDDKQGKMKAVSAIMRQMGGQGKLGAVEISNLSKEMAKLGAATGSFAGDKTEIFAQLGGMMQTSMGAKGGSASAGQAATSIMAFARDLPKKNVQEGLQKLGVDVFADKEHRKMKAPEQIIEDIVTKTGGSLDKLAKVVPNAMSFRAVKGYATVYNDAEAKQKGSGLDAIKKEFQKMRDASMGEGEIQAGFKEAMDGPAAHAQLFQTQLEDLVAKMSKDVIPALEKMAPAVTEAAAAFGKIVSWAASNPWTAVSSMVGLSLAKAVAESVAASGFAKALEALVGGTGGAAGGIAGRIGGVVAAGGLGYAVGTAMTGGIDQNLKKSEGDRFSRSMEATTLAARIRSGKATPQEMARAQALQGQLEGDASGGGGFLSHMKDSMVSGGKGLLSGDFSMKNLAGAVPLSAAVQAGLQTQQGGLGAKDSAASASDLRDAMSKALKDGVIKVQVVNAPNVPVLVDESARTK